MSDITLFQDNAITRARYDLSALELNIFFNVLKQIRIEKDSQFTYQINISDVIDHNKERATNHTALRRATKTLIGKVIDIPQDKEGGYMQSALISAANYQGGSGRVLIQISEMIKPYLIDVAKNTTRYQFEIAVKLKSVYSKRFYQFISQWRVAGRWRVSLQELRERLQLQKSYKNYGDFKTYVLNVAHEQLILHGDIYFTYEEVKQGRRVTDFIFEIQANKNYHSQQKTVIQAKEANQASEQLFPIDSTRLIKSLKELELADWQIRNVLLTFKENEKDLFAEIYSINMIKTVRSVGAKAWSIFTKKHNVPLKSIK